MKLEAPEGFDHNEFYAGITMAQAWNIFPGHNIEGHKNVQQHLGALDAPTRFDGMRVLEIAPWNGFFGFEILRRGAREVVALGPDSPDDTGFHKTAKLLDVESRITYVRDSVYNIKSHSLGTFDAVFCLGLLYHLRHPLLAIDLLHDHCAQGGLMFVDSVIVDTFNKVLPPDGNEMLLEAWAQVKALPLSLCVRGDIELYLSADPYNWFAPNSAGFRAWVRSSGFSIEHDQVVDDWISLKLRCIPRPFVDGLEGFNPGVQRR